MITDQLINARLYPLGEAWEKAIAFIQTLDASSTDGEYPIKGEDIFARVMSYETKDPEDARFEAHQKYADIQSTLIGAEGIAVTATNFLEIDEAYNPETDVAFFKTPEAVPTLVDVYPGSFVYLLPQDCHMPQLQVGNKSQLIKKVVVKIALGELGL